MAIHSKIGASLLTAVVSLLVATSMASGRGYYCAPYRVRVTNADTIVIGRTIGVIREEVRPTLYAVTFEFLVDRVLKGDLYKAGDTIVKRYEPDRRMIGYQPFPWDDKGFHLLFVNRNAGGNERFACAVSVAHVDLDSIRRQIEVQEDPTAFLDSANEQDVTTVLDWIKRTYIRYEPSGESRTDWSGKSKPNRETVIRYLLRHARGESAELRVEALTVLVIIHPPEAFDAFQEALQSKDDGDMIALAAQGFRLLADVRALPFLTDRLRRFRKEKAKRNRRLQNGEEDARLKLRSIGWVGPPHRRSPERELHAAVTSFDDPRVEQFILESLSEADDWSRFSYLGKQKDPQAVEPLLRLLWEGKVSAIGLLQEYDDERIAEEARARMYDHPLAPQLLAVWGDPSDREFMSRLIRQGFREGFIWAAAARDESLKADLVRALNEYWGDTHSMRRIGYALGRIRAFDVVASLLEKESSDFDALIHRAEVLLGLADRPVGLDKECEKGEMWNCIRQSLRNIAEREEWTKDQENLAAELLDSVENHQSLPDRFHLHSRPRKPWSPPVSLPDMPDPLDKEATRTYLEENAERWRRVFDDGSSEDQSKLLQAAQNCKMNILDNDTAVRLLVGTDWKLHNLVRSALRSESLVLNLADIERWAFTGDFRSTRAALGYMCRDPKPEYTPIVTRIFFQRQHLSEEALYVAIIETQATDCVPLLRAYLEKEHYALRVNAAITLIHLGDDAGKAVLAELAPNLRNCRTCLKRHYRQEALDRLN